MKERKMQFCGACDLVGETDNKIKPFFLGSKITADGDCSHEIKRNLLLGRKVMTNLDSILKSREKAAMNSMHDTECFGLLHWDDPEGWYVGRREEGSGCRTHVYLWWIHVDIW